MGAYLIICLAISIYLVNTQDFNPIMAITIILTYQANFRSVSDDAFINRALLTKLVNVGKNLATFMQAKKVYC